MHILTSTIRRLAGGMAGALALAAVPSGATALASPASAVGAANPPSTSVVQCLGTQAVTYTPGLTLTPQQVALNVSGTVGPCVTTAGSDYSGGHITVSGSGTLSCSVGGSSSGTQTITWLGGEKSVFAYQGAVSLRPDGVTVLLLTGSITSGAFAGEKASAPSRSPLPTSPPASAPRA